MIDLLEAPVTTTAPAEPGHNDRHTHIVNEGVSLTSGEFLSAGPSVAEGFVMGVPVEGLCGWQGVPRNDPRKYGLCPDCVGIAKGMGWEVPGG